MPSSFTTNLRLTLPATGENAGTWGTLVNTGITTLIDSSIAGTASVTMTDANYTLTNLNGTTDEARCMFINLTGTLTATRNVICPSASKLYFVYNNTTGSQAIVFKTSAGSGITIPNGKRAALYCNGTNVVYAFDQVSLTPTVTISGDINSTATDYGVNLTSTTIKSNVTTLAAMYRSNPSTDATSFTLAALDGFRAEQNTFGGGSTVTTQRGFHAVSSLTGAQNNYGFYSDIATQSAVSLFSIVGSAGTVTVTTATAHGLTTGDTVLIAGVSNVTMTSGSYNGGPYTVSVTNTTVFTFSSTAASPAISSSGSVVRANRWNFYAAGTGQNYFGGPVVVSANSFLPGLRVTQVGSGDSFVVEDASGGDSTPFVVNTVGNVGVGISNPSVRLEVQNASGQISIFGNTTGSERLHFYTRNTAGTSRIETQNSDFQLFAYDGNNLTLGTSNTERLRIDSAGNVGIGTSNPTDKFNVVGSVSAGSVVARIANNFGDINSSAVLSLDPNGNGFNVRDAQIRGINVNGSTQAALGFYTSNGATPVEAMRITHDRKVLVGSTSSIGGNMSVWNGLYAGANDSTAEIQNYRASDNAAGPFLYLNKARGTIASPTIVVTGDDVGSVIFRGYDGAAYRETAKISSQVDGALAAGDMPGRLVFFTTPDGTTTAIERMRIDNAGNVGLGTTNPTALLSVNGVGAFGAGTAAAPSIARFGDLNTGLWFPTTNNIAVSTAGVERLRIDASGNFAITGPGTLGYGTGSGGTVTQATSRTTGVTLNKTNGQITLVSAAGTTAWQSFLVTNSTVNASDTIIVNQDSGTDNYQIFVTRVASGSFRIMFATTGGTTVEQPVFNFAVISAVTS